MNPGIAARYLEGFTATMAASGHNPLTIRGYLDSAIHFGGWVFTFARIRIVLVSGALFA